MPTRNENGTRKHWLNIRLTQAEHQQIMQALNKTTDRKLSQYARKMLLGKPVRVLTRNKSLDDLMENLIGLKIELNALGNNFNQVVKRLNSVQKDSEVSFWMGVARQQQQQLLSQTEAVQSFINKFSEQWFQNS